MRGRNRGLWEAEVSGSWSALRATPGFKEGIRACVGKWVPTDTGESWTVHMGKSER